MKKVLLKRYRFSFKDILRILLIILAHIVAIYAYVMLNFAIAYATGLNQQFWLKINQLSWGILYPLTLAPFVNAFLHIYYSYKGSILIRFLMWFHSFGIIILVPILTFTAG